LNGLPFLGLVGLGRHPGSDPPYCILAAGTANGKTALTIRMLLRSYIVLQAMPARITENWEE